MVKKQYGMAVLVEEVNKLIQTELQKFLTEEKLDVLGNPIPKNVKLLLRNSFQPETLNNAKTREISCFNCPMKCGATLSLPGMPTYMMKCFTRSFLPRNSRRGLP